MIQRGAAPTGRGPFDCNDALCYRFLQRSTDRVSPIKEDTAMDAQLRWSHEPPIVRKEKDELYSDSDADLSPAMRRMIRFHEAGMRFLRWASVISGLFFLASVLLLRMHA